MHKTIFSLSIAGLLFAGYMSGVKFLSKTCAFGETCPYFFGIPACYIGLLLFLILTVWAGVLVYGRKDKRQVLRNLCIVSFIGILFAGYYTIPELPLLFAKGFSAYVLGLPTCALGFIFYVFIFVLTLKARK